MDRTVNDPEKKPGVSAIAAIGAHDRAIGGDNELLWYIPDDLKRFKQLTRGHPIVLGRKTFESILNILGKPLPERENIVVTRNSTYTHPGATIVHSVDAALAHARTLDADEVFVGGGANVWEQALPQIDKLYLTLIDDTKPADAFFPAYEHLFATELFREERKTSDGLRYTWLDLAR